MRRPNTAANITAGILGGVFVIWFALLIAPFSTDGLYAIVTEAPRLLKSPLNIQWCENSLSTVLVMLFIYGIAIVMIVSTRKNYRYREEHGSAKWGSLASIGAKYRSERFENNILLTQNCRIGLDDRVHNRNVHVLVVGGSGAGKTRGYAKPNVYQANTSFVVIDPKGEILRDSGYLLLSKGYEIRVLDLIDMEKSHGYNPFMYLEDDNDVQRLVTNLFRATSPKNYSPQDPFWDNAANMLITALILYLKYEAPEDEQNFSMVLEMLREADVSDDDDDARSPLDILFDDLEREKPGHIASNYYRQYRKGAGRTLKSIIITAAVRMEKFNLPAVASMTSVDELDITSVGERKVALFARIPVEDTSFNFLVSMLYTQLFQGLFRLADSKYNGRLPMHVHFLMDEFANISLPEDFEKILSVMRSYNISASIILQNIAQLKALYEKQWESIVGNCDEFLYLGGNEQSTHKYVSELLGKETIDTNSFGKQHGFRGSFSTNYQNGGRDLLDPAEVRLLDNKEAMLFIRGERPVMDRKFNILCHPNVKLSADGGAKKYDHGPSDRTSAKISRLDGVGNVQSSAPYTTEDHKYTLLTGDELETILLLSERKN